MNRNWSEILQTYKKSLAHEGKTINTISCYCSDVKLFIHFSELDLPSQIKPEEIQRYKQSTETRLSSKTVSRKLRSIKHFCAFLIRKGTLKHNPMEEIQIPTAKRGAISILNDIEIYNLLEAAKANESMYVAISLLLQTGIKISELVNVTKRDIVLNNSHAKLKVDNRTVPLNDKILYILKDYIPNSKIVDYLFTTRDSNPIHVRNMRTYISRIFKKAGISKTVNDLRNTFIVKQLLMGNSVEYVGELVGHSSKQATERYLRLVKNYKNKKLNRIVEV